MVSFRTHLTVLAESSSRFPSSPAFRLPIVNASATHVEAWHTITYQQFHSDVELFAKYWARTLRRSGASPRSVVGLWLGGLTYIDVCHIYGIARAGYVPQLFSLKLPNPDVIYELLQKSNAKALIFEPSCVPDLSGSPFPTHIAVDVRGMDLRDEPLPRMVQGVKGSDTVMIFHTSGSTSGRPKVIPCSYSWLETMVWKSSQVTTPIRQARHDVTSWLGSLCHIGQTFMLLGLLQHGACVVQPTRIDFSTAELADMVARCALNRLFQWPAYLGQHLRAARHDMKVLGLLCGLDEILYSGQAMPVDDEEFAYGHGMRVTNLFGSTECGAMLLSARGAPAPFPPVRPMHGVSYAFVPIADSEDDAAPAPAGYHNAHAQLLELVIRAESGDCPDASLRSADGHYHTGDLFVEVAPGWYAPRGRNDDWIKSENSLRCDTKAIEDNVRATCGELVASCIVVGYGRPSPVLFVEPRAGAADRERLKREIIRKTRHFHARRYVHERITSAKMVVVVPQGTLPRTATKGNIRRRAVEHMFKAELDRIFA